MVLYSSNAEDIARDLAATALDSLLANSDRHANT